MAILLKIYVLLLTMLLVISVIDSQTTLPSQQTSVTEVTTQSAQQPEDPAPTESEIEKNTDVGICTCDLTTNACDVNCCCDPDCSAEDRESFSECADQITEVDSRLCVKDTIMFRDNTPYDTETTEGGLFCVQTDNYEERNYYKIPDPVTTDAQFDEYIEDYGSPSFEAVDRADELSTDPYKSGGLIYTIYASATIGILAQPTSTTFSKNCLDSNPAAYMFDRSYSCSRQFTDLPSECAETNLAITSTTYFSAFKVITNPAVMNGELPNPGNETEGTAGPSTVTIPTTAPTTVPTTMSPEEASPNTPDDVFNDGALSVEVDTTGPHTCIDVDGIHKPDCNAAELQPAYDPDTAICANVVAQVEYHIIHNGTTGISSVSATFTLRDVQASQLPLQQIHTTKYNFIGELDGDTVPLVRSGNPGYIVGRPLRAGTLNSDIENLPDDTVRQAIEIDNLGITLVRSSVNGECVTDLDNRVTATFGEAMRSGCNIKVFLSNMSSECVHLQEQALNALRPEGSPDRVATFGNTDPEDVGDWVEIRVENLPTQTLTSNQEGVCPSIVLGLHIEVLYSNVGALGNPQAKILGVKYSYETGEVRFQCTGSYCQPGSEDLPQVIEIVHSISYIDVSQPAVHASAPSKKSAARLPDDFFYPLK